MKTKRLRSIRILQLWMRRRLARFDRSAPSWLAWLPSWGTSLLIHGLALAILAVVALASNPSTATRSEIDSALVEPGDPNFAMSVMDDHPGDPLGLATVEPESAPTSGPPVVGPELPGMAVDSTFGTLVELDKDNSIVSLPADRPVAAFAGRQRNREESVRREGGTTASERAVELGLRWLSRHQREDGGWGLDVSKQCRDRPGCPEEPQANSDTAATGLALLAFLGAGHSPSQPGPYRREVDRGVEWLLAHQQKTGELFLGGMENSQMYSHGIASMALCEAYGISKSPRLELPSQSAINFIVRAQNKTDGGWRYTPGVRGDTSVFGWQMFALRSASLSGLKVSKNVINGCQKYLDRAAADKDLTTYAYEPGDGASHVMSAEALLCRQYLGWRRDRPALIKGVANVWDNLQGHPQRNIYYWYYATQLLHNMGNDAWKQWNPIIRDGLVKAQVTTGGCENGSWSPTSPEPDRWGTTAGRLYQTSMSILTLEVYYRFLPLYRTNERPVAADRAAGL